MTILISAFLIGMLGSVHCVGMCGGIVGILSQALGKEHVRPWFHHMSAWLAYNLGRILSYAVAGMIAGFLGGATLNFFAVERAHEVGSMIAGFFMLLLGLYITGWWNGLQVLEKGGSKFWHKIAPLGQKYLQAKTPLDALRLGLVWGWLPCGLVYSTLAWSLVSASPVAGAGLMIAFGLGTLPMLMLMGAGADKLSRFTANKKLRLALGMLVMLLGLLTFVGLMSPAHHSTMASGNHGDIHQNHSM